jgi:uncharacterized protein (TIGR03118 family)
MKGFFRSKLVLSIATLVMLVAAIAVLLLQLLPFAADARGAGFYQRTNLVSDINGVARFTDANLVNPWGLSHSPTGPWRVSDNGTGVSTQYQGNGTSVPPVVTIPLPTGGTGTAAPTGNVFNPTDDFVVSRGGVSSPSQFIFATEDGTISGWNPKVNPTHAIREVDRSTVKKGKFLGAVYKGLALVQNSSGNFLFATNFRFGKVEMFDANFNLVKSFTDPDLSEQCDLNVLKNQCFAPFGIQNIQGKLYVTFAFQTAGTPGKPGTFKHDDQAGPGNGFVDVFDTNGNFIKRLISHGKLNSPWGLTLTPNDFGQFSNDLLVGNFGDGHINAFDPKTGHFLGQPKDQFGNPIVIDDLWGLAFGNGAAAGQTDELFFTAGIADETHGLFGSIESE